MHLASIRSKATLLGRRALESAWSPDDSEERKSQKSAMVAYSFLMFLGGILWGTICIL